MESRQRYRRAIALLGGACLTLVVSASGGCGTAVSLPATGPDGGGATDGGFARDGGVVVDAGLAVDGGVAADGGFAVDGGSTGDGGIAQDGGIVIEVGGGVFSFEPVAADGGALQMVCGPQGGQHIWLSARTLAGLLDPRQVSLLVEIKTTDNQEHVCGLNLTGVDLFPNDGGTHHEYTGIQCFIGDPARFAGRPGRMHGRVGDSQGRVAEGYSPTVPIRAPERSCVLGDPGDGGAFGGGSDGGTSGTRADGG